MSVAQEAQCEEEDPRTDVSDLDLMITDATIPPRQLRG